MPIKKTLECPGVYKLAEMRDGLLARVRIVGGTLRTKDLHNLADAATTFGNGKIDITNRANLQVRGISNQGHKKFVNYLQKLKLIPDNPIHDRLRNITIDPLSGLADEDVDCRPLAKTLDVAIATVLNEDNKLESLSPKFSVVLDGGGPSNIAAVPHDICLIAQGIYFRLKICGNDTQLAVIKENAVGAILNLMQSLKYIATDNGIKDTGLRLKIIQKEIGIDRLTNLIKDTVPEFSDHGFRAETSSLENLNPSTGALQIKGETSYAVTLSARTNRIEAHQLKGLAELTERFGKGLLRLTPWQAIIVEGIKEEDIAEVWQLSEALGFLTQPHEQNLRIITCAGSEGCPKGQFETHATAIALREALVSKATRKPTTVHLSACEKGCASRQIADYLYMQRQSEIGASLYRGAEPRTAKNGTHSSTEKLVLELEKNL